MNILFIVPFYKPAYSYGGPIVVIARLAETLVAMGHTVTVYTSTANGAAELPVVPGQPMNVDGVCVYYFKRVTGDNTHASPALWLQLDRTIHDFEVVHIHSWWNFLVLGAAWVCRRHSVKPIISPHGMLSEYILTTNNAAKKRWLHRLVGKKLLAASVLHVSTKLELEESRQVIPGWPGQIIPNLVALPQYAPTRPANDVFTIGFLSRVDPKKGLDVLIRVLGQITQPYRLLVAGTGSETYIQELHALAAEVGNADKITWVGWKNGEDKFTFLAELDLFALTSHSENFAIVVIESLATGTPVLISDQVGLYQYVREHDYGWVTPLDPAQVVATLQAAMRDHAKRQRIGATAPVLIRREYDDRTLAQHYLDLYQAPAAHALPAL
ncbi:XrtY-associated glycosyltransferase XYAG1 [Hymenobacter psoromatis]|uniref:XrtY-associated glycosyltransferase XYAG1 n=1 Tax=Hymenobacter psoromatis TaxID=1484116 RepID=UPI001CBCBCAF|nr:glycosyltransferase [Hymenobacter psoromatis]